VLIISDAKSTF